MHELIEGAAEYQLAALRPHRLRADPRQQQTRQRAEGQPLSAAGRHVEHIRAITPDVFFPVAWVGARQGAQRHQPRHEPEIGLRFAGLDELRHLAQRGEVVPRPRGHGAPAPLDARQPYGHLTDRHEPAAFLLHAFVFILADARFFRIVEPTLDESVDLRGHFGFT